MFARVHAFAWFAITVLGACGAPGSSQAPAPGAAVPIVIHLGPAVDAAGEGSVAVDVPAGAGREITVELDGAPRVVEIGLAGAAGRVEASAKASAWIRPRPVLGPRIALAIEGDLPARVTVWARGAPVPRARRERSLVWTDPAVADDKSLVSLGRVLAAASDDGHGGRMLDRWLRRFATTSHSERAAPASFADEIALQQGSDPTAWKLDGLPFTVTGVHNRIDLAARGVACGELRVSLSSLHQVFAPLHLIFLFRQDPNADDRAPDGTVHCLGSARRWARLSTLEGPAFVEAARRIVAESVRRDRFLLAETVELTVSPWEWRQWTRVGPDELDNPPLFQTLDTEALNAPGPRRDDLLSFVSANAAALDARAIELPERFRAPSARVPPSAPRTTLSLDGLPAPIAARYPKLSRQIEIVGCPACHTENAEFVQTSRERAFSKFYDKELDARAARLDLMNAGSDVAAPPFGPLQE